MTATVKPNLARVIAPRQKRRGARYGPERALLPGVWTDCV